MVYNYIHSLVKKHEQQMQLLKSKKKTKNPNPKPKSLPILQPNPLQAISHLVPSGLNWHLLFPLPKYLHKNVG